MSTGTGTGTEELSGQPGGSRLECWILAAIPVAFAARVWVSILRNYFHADDFLHLYRIADQPALEFLFSPFGGHLCVVRNLAFYASFRLLGPRPEAFFATVYLTHLLNVALLFRVLRVATRSPWAACVGATLWGICPVLEGTLGWYSVYGQVLGTTCALVVLEQALRAGTDGLVVSRRRALGWGLLLVAGANCFGTGMGIALAFPVAVAILIPAGRRRGVVPILVGAALFVVAEYLATLRLAYGQADQPYAGFIVFAWLVYVRPQAEMLLHLLAYGATALVAGDLLPLLGYPGVAATAVVALLAALVVAAAVRGPAPRRRPLAVAALLTVSAYGMIALGRGTYLTGWSRFGPTPGTVSRYHYMGLALMALLLVSAASSVLADRLTRGARVRLVGWGLAALVVAWLTRPLVDHHATDRAHARKALLLPRLAASLVRPGEVAVAPNVPFPPTFLSNAEFPGYVGLFLIFFPTDEVDGRTIRYAVTQPVLERLTTERPGSRLARLLVPIEPLQERWALDHFGPMCPLDASAVELSVGEIAEALAAPGRLQGK